MIIVVIVVAVLMRRSGRGGVGSGGSGAGKTGPMGKTDDRNVVAFENPMYEGSAATGVGDRGDAVGLYDNAGIKYSGSGIGGGGDGDDGLYDEPAFTNEREKANPLYASTEHLHDGSDPDNVYMDTDGVGETGAGEEYIDTNVQPTYDVVERERDEDYGFENDDEADDVNPGYLDVAPTPEE